MKHLLDLAEARLAYAAGQNVTEYLRTRLGVASNTADIIEMAYDLQSGSYSTYARDELAAVEANADEMAAVIRKHATGAASILDVGTGELTTLSMLCRRLLAPQRLLAFDISWSRLRHGLEFSDAHMPAAVRENLEVFVADMASIPLPTGSVDLVLSNHALEPNGGRERELMKELFRVTARTAILFEPSYERASPEGRERMARLGYVRDLERVGTELGARLVETVPLEHIVSHPLNRTVAYVFAVEPPSTSAALLTDPGEEGALVRHADCHFSPRHGVAYPTIGGIPILLAKSAVLASSMDRFVEQAAP